MTYQQVIVTLSIASALVLVGCTQKPVPVTKTTTPSLPTNSQTTTGNINEDVSTTEAELDSLNVDSDFPVFSNSDF